MEKQSILVKAIQSQGVLPLYFHPDAEVSVQVLKALYNAGIRLVEYTNRGPEALANFKILRQHCDTDLDGMSLAIGTVKNRAEAEKFIEERADLLICPGLAEDVIQTAQEHDILCIPGCMTASEIMRAENAGIGMVKLFPGNLLGPEYVKAIRPIFPHLQFMPTGGVELDEQNIRNWFASGVCAVGLGSKLIDDSILARRDYAAVEVLAKKALAIVAAARQQR